MSHDVEAILQGAETKEVKEIGGVFFDGRYVEVVKIQSGQLYLLATRGIGRLLSKDLHSIALASNRLRRASNRQKWRKVVRS